MKLSIIIPAHNEEHRLPPTLIAYAEYFREQYPDEFELIVVVNHCSDATETIAKRLAGEYGEVSVVVEPSRVGKGGAVEIGMKKATGELVGFVDADGATPPREFRTLIDNIGEAEAIIASRWIAGAEVNPPQSLLRRAASRVLNHLIVRLLFGLKIHDSQCGAKLFRRDVLEKILCKPLEPGWAFDIDILCRLNRNHYTVIEFPAEWRHKSGSSATFIVMSLQMLSSILRLKRAQLSHRKKESQ